MSCKRFLIAGQHVISKHVEAPFGHHRRVELANRARGGVARIRKARLAFFLALRVNLFKDLPRQVRFAAHFDLAGCFLRLVAQPERHAANRAHVRTYVFAARAVAARNAAHEQSVLVVDRKRQPIDFQFNDIVGRTSAGQLATALVERSELLNVVAVVERKHRATMDEFGKAFGGATADALGWAVRREKLRMLLFQSAQLFDQLVILAIRNLRIVPDVVEFFVALNLFAQFGDRFSG